MDSLPRHLWQTTPELEASVLAEIRENHIGPERAIKAPALARLIGCSERKARAAVNSLRKQGCPICSGVGNPAGFYWPRTMREYEEFYARNYRSRIVDMAEVARKMKAGAEKYFDDRQLELFA